MSRQEVHKNKKQFTQSLRRRLLTLFTIGLILTFLVIGLATYLLISRAENDSWLGRRNDAALNATETIAAFMERTTNSLALVAILDPNYLKSNPQVFSDWLAQNPALLEVIRLDRFGNVVGGGAQPGERPVLANPFTIKQSNWFINPILGNTNISDVQISSDDKPYLIMSVPAINNGVLAARLDMRVLWEVVGRIRYGQTGNAYIIDRLGFLIGHTDPQVVLARTTINNRPEWQKMISADADWNGNYQNFLGKRVLGQSTPIADTDWLVITEIERNEATSLSRWTLILVSLGLLVTIPVALWGSSRLLDTLVYEPVNALHERISSISEEGHLDKEQIAITRHDELGELAYAFNQMSLTLHKRDQQLATQNQALEREVQERKQAQETLQRLNAELVQSSRYKDQFLATMSHELRTPLNAILGMSEALMVPVYGQLNAQQQKAITHIRESGQHLLSLIDEILDLSKIAAGKSALEFTLVMVESVAQSALRLIRPMVTSKKLTLTTSFDSQVTAMMVDERRLKQILSNLLNNAVKFTPEGGAIGLEIEGDREHDVVRFIIWDNGIGMPKDALNQLFEPFLQLDGGLARQYGGTGLGLALVHRLVDMHGGSVSVESELKKGSRFIVSLPWKEPETLRTQSADEMKNYVEEGESQAKGATILLAEDREANILTLLDYLTIKGFDVSVARNGKQAVEMTQASPPNLILMDIQMPEMNGLDAIRHIRADDRTKNIPIVALTALAMPGDREKCLEAGANDYISKPISLRQLVEVIESQLHSV